MYMLVGAGSVQVCTEAMLKGVGIVKGMKEGLAAYADRKGFDRVADMVGLALPKIVGNQTLSRTLRKRPLIDRWRCLGCGRCVDACATSGYSALRLEAPGRQAAVDSSLCDDLQCQYGAGNRARVIEVDIVERRGYKASQRN